MALTAQQIHHISNLAAERARNSAHSSEQWEAVVALKLLAHSVADREIAANGFSMMFAPMH